jgi:hypothetical protein
MAVFYLIVGPVIVVLGGLIIVFRSRYTAWQNRARPPKRESQAFGPRLAIFYGILMLGAGLYLTIFPGVLRLHH